MAEDDRSAGQGDCVAKWECQEEVSGEESKRSAGQEDHVTEIT